MAKQNQDPGPGRSTSATAFDDVRKEFIKSRMPLNTMQPLKVRAKLKKMGLSKYYEHSELIAHAINPEYQPIQIDSEREEKLCEGGGGCTRDLSLA